MVRRRPRLERAEAVLPAEAHTDFVFAVLAEEFGFVGVVIVLALFTLLAGRALAISRNAARAGLQFQSYVAASIGVWLGLQGVREHRRQHGPAAHQGTDLAAAVVRRQQHARDARLLGVLLRVHHETQTTGRAAVSREERRP